MDIFIMIGYRWRTKLMASFPFECQTCNRNTIQVYGKNIKKFTLFMIPTVTLEVEPFVYCSECNTIMRVPYKQAEELDSRALQAAPPFRICPKCSTRNEMETIMCQACDEQIQPTVFPQKGGARFMAILLTSVFVFLFLSFCVAVYFGLR